MADRHSISSMEEMEDLEMVTTSLAEVLSCRNHFLEDRELWALCRECCLTLEYVHDCYDLFQSLCISPDTVAFDPEGNVCFLDLDMEPEPLYIAPEAADNGNSYKSHLFSLGMTLLYATHFNTESDDPNAKISDDFSDLLTALTCDDAELRPQLDPVIEICDRALDGELSQIICLNIVGTRGGAASVTNDDSSLLQVTGELSAYLESQSGLVQTQSAKNSLPHTQEEKPNTTRLKDVQAPKDYNDNCIPKGKSSKDGSGHRLSIIKDILKEANLDEEEIMSLNEAPITPRHSKRQGIMLADMLQSLGRFLDESELWALCRESVLCLKRKKKHLPAYLSLDTIMVCDTGMITFKAIPEDKPLEVVYMAPELQQKGILNERTCLYGLGITLKSAAGINVASPHYSIQDGEALEILIQSFLQAKAERRPALDTAFEMCEEYEKSSDTKSRDVCLAFYKEALSKVTLDKSEDSPAVSTSEPSQRNSLDKDSSRWDSSEPDHTQTSSDNTQSMFQGEITDGEDNIDDIPFDGEDQTVLSGQTAFKPVNVGKNLSSSAFKPLPTKPQPLKDQYRVPSAFSSPATHFKPIVLHESQSSSTQQTNQTNSGKQDVDVMSKLREIKQNLMKHKNTELPDKDSPNLPRPSAIKKKAENPETNDSSNLSSYMKQLKSQGNMPDTDTLASAIAKYLKNELIDSPLMQQADERRSRPSDNQASFPVNTSTIQQPLPNSSNEFSHSNHRPIPHPTDNFNPPPHSYTHPNTGHPYQVSYVPNQMLYTSVDPNDQKQSQAAHNISMNQNQNPYNPNFPPMQYSIPFSGIHAQSVPSFQLTLVPDPATGIMQMVPVPYIQVQNQPQIHPSHHGNNTHGTISNSLTTSGALPYKGDTQLTHNSPALYPYQRYTVTPSSLHQESEFKNTSQNGVMNFQENHRTVNSVPSNTAANANSQQEAGDSNSHSSSPSPSKDSGICLTQQPPNLPYNKESLMDKFLSSENSQRKKILSQVLNIVREEFSEEGVVDTAAEDLAIAEYIVSLISLKWETFCSAVKEKYKDLVWTQDVLMILFETLNTSDSRVGSRTDPPPRTSTLERLKHNKLEARPEQLDTQQRSNPPTNNKVPSIHTHAEEKFSHHRFTATHNMRPKSELGAAFHIAGEASDSPDSEYMDKRRRFKKRYELDKKKSSSLHNVSVTANTSLPHSSLENQTIPAMNNVHSTQPNIRNPSVFSKDYFLHGEYDTKTHSHFLNASHPPSSSRSHPQTLTHQPNMSHNPPHAPGPVAFPTTPNSLATSQVPPLQLSNLKDSKQILSMHNVQHDKPFQILPSKTNCDNSHSHLHEYDSSSSNSPKDHHRSPNSSFQQKYLSPYSLNDSSGTPYSQLRKKKSMQSSGTKPNLPLAGDHTIQGSYTPEKGTEPRHQRVQNHQRNSISYMEYNDGNSENNSDSDYSASAEMRRLAAKKPELFDRRTPLISTPIDKNMNKNSIDQLPVSNQRPSSRIRPEVNESAMYGSRHTSHENVSDRSKNPNSSGMKSNPGKENDLFHGARQERRPNSRSGHTYGRSMSAVYSSQTADIGVKVLDQSFDERVQRSAADADDLPDINSALLLYTKKGQVVYHSAMIQLSLTPDVDTFIHSIDEENKSHIENKLTSVTQEINIQWKQRKKSQRFFQRLSEQNSASKTSKNDQHVGGQVLKDMAEMTRKLNYLILCKTHLQMLLAELDGLDVCYLHSLSACDHNEKLTLQPMMENKYLQFRTISTQQAGAMAVLQAGTPRGLLSYLYTSSALSDGFIHQFLLCFRYILTADQMLNFIVDTYRSAQRSNQKDVNMIRVQHRSLDLLQFWIEGYFSIDFASNNHLTKRLAIFLRDQTEANVEGADNLYSLYAACRLGEHSELMNMTEIEEDDDQDSTYFLHIANPKQWESFRSLLKRSKSDKSLNTSGGSGKLKSSDNASLGPKSSNQFSLADCEVHVLAEQLTLLEQKLYRNCHPVHFLNSQFQGVGVALSMPGMRTPSMTRKMEPSESKRGLFIGDPSLEPTVVRMISHSQELAHWVSAEILSCGSNKVQTNIMTKFIGVANMCLSVRNYATALSILEGLDNLVIRQLPIWKNVAAKYICYMEELKEMKMKMKSESMWLTTSKDFHIYPTIHCALFAALHLQQMEVGGFTLANGFFKWDKMRSISETVDQIRIFRDHEYGFQADPGIQRAIQRRLNEFSDQDLHAVASTHENNFRQQLSSSSVSGTLKRMKDKLKKK